MYQITNGVWLSLYDVSNQLQNINCKPGELVIIQDPHTQEIGYCVLDKNVEGNTISVYIGKQGLLSYIDLLTAAESELGQALYLKYLYRQQGMTVSFQQEEDLLREDIDQIKNLGFVLEDQKHWSVFSRLFPGSKPTFIEDLSEVMFLTRVLQRLRQILEEIESKPFHQGEDDYIFSKVEDGVWKTDYIDMDLVLEDDKPSPYKVEYGNELKAHRVKKLVKLNKTFEGIQFLMPTELWSHEQERALYPLFTAFVEQSSGVCILGEIGDHSLDGFKQISESLADTLLDELKYRPSLILVEDEYLLDMINDFCEKVGIKCACGVTLQAESFMESMTSERIKHSNRIQDNFIKLMMVCEETFEKVMKTKLSETLSEEEKDCFNDVLTFAIIYMIKTHHEFPLNWSSDAFEEMLQSRILEQNLLPEEQANVYHVLFQYLRAAKEIGLLNHANQLEYILNEYYPQ